MKIILCGAKGQLGTECNGLLSQNHSVRALGSCELDIRDGKAVFAAVEDINPDVIINCAAFTRVDACETERESAYALNVKGPENLARAAKERDALLIHISSDYVFDGKKEVPVPYLESDPTGPVSFYGRTKWEGEEAVRNECPRHMILRTAWLYGERGGNFLKTMLRLATGRPDQPIRVVNDQYGSPTWARRLAMQIGALIMSGKGGTYHATSEGWCTWYELAVFFLETMGIRREVLPISTNEYPTAARRPKNSILENSRLKEEGINVMVDWREDVMEFSRRAGKLLILEAQGGR